MRVKDEAGWSRAQQWFDETEERQAFRDYLVFWTQEADKLVDRGFSPLDSLRQTLEDAEKAIGMTKDPNAFGQLLVFVVGMWEYADDVVEEMTPMELHVLASATRLHIEELQELAQLEGDGLDSDYGTEEFLPTE